MSFGLAVQGIGGMNNFAAGVLYRLRERKILPEAISTTSGGINCVYGFLDEDPKYLLQIKNKSSSNYKRNIFSREIQGLKIFLERSMGGLPGVYRNIGFTEKMTSSFFDIDPLDPFSTINALMPAKSFESTIPFSKFENYSERFQKSKIPILTNAYNYKTGKTVVILNKASQNYFKGTRFQADHDEEFDIRPMTPDYVKGALQLIQYGPYMDMIDGAYQYNPFITPLKKTKNIIIICVVPFSRPLKPLENVFDIEDFKIKMMFNNAIASEISNINLMNKIIDEGVINDKKYEKIKIHIVEPKIHKGFFDYFVEDTQIFQDGYDQIEKVLQHL